MARAYHVTLVGRGDAALSNSVGQAWDRLVFESARLYALYQSPPWWEHLHATGQGEGLRLAIVKNTEGQLVGVAPVRAIRQTMDFAAGRRTLLRLPLRSTEVLGSEPLLPGDPDAYAELFGALWAAFPRSDAIYLKCLLTEDRCWAWLRQSVSGGERFLVHCPHAVRPFHSIVLPSTFDAYLAKFGAKKRYNLKRQVRLLRDRGGGSLQLQRVECDDQVEGFLDAAESVSWHSWQHRYLGAQPLGTAAKRRELVDLARRGLLRSYLLNCGGRPGAFVVGYQFAEVYHYADVGYDEAFADCSPGAVLLYQLIEDLIHYRPPRRVNLGVGHSDYKSQFGNEHSEHATVLLLRNTFANRVRHAFHTAFLRLGRFTKSLLRRRAAL